MSADVHPNSRSNLRRALMIAPIALIFFAVLLGGHWYIAHRLIVQARLPGEISTGLLWLIGLLGATLVLPSVVEKLDPHDFLSTAEREKCISFSIVGDAFARPLLDQLEKRDYDLSNLMVVGSGGAPFSTAHKKAFLEKLPHATIMDAIGSSETGAQATNPSTVQSGVSTGDFRPGPGACVVSEDLSRRLEAGDEEVGWFAQTGRVPLGYFGDSDTSCVSISVVTVSSADAAKPGVTSCAVAASTRPSPPSSTSCFPTRRASTAETA